MSAKKVFAVLLLTAQLLIGIAWSDSSAPVPLLQKDQPVDWWFVFKFNGATHPGCDGDPTCPFGGTVRDYKGGQQYVYASSRHPSLEKGTGCIGATSSDPVSATFDQVYNGSYSYVRPLLSTACCPTVLRRSTPKPIKWRRAISPDSLSDSKLHHSFEAQDPQHESGQGRELPLPVFPCVGLASRCFGSYR